MVDDFNQIDVISHAFLWKKSRLTLINMQNVAQLFMESGMLSEVVGMLGRVIDQ